MGALQPREAEAGVFPTKRRRGKEKQMLLNVLSPALILRGEGMALHGLTPRSPACLLGSGSSHTDNGAEGM